jgi:hypothetical protein|tara:strand:+ start:54 stop:263 length:210 start_codon:yes stop_codon:yes gene_type:complete
MNVLDRIYYLQDHPEEIPELSAHISRELPGALAIIREYGRLVPDCPEAPLDDAEIELNNNLKGGWNGEG